ncbi:MAG: BolA/IbaG family iron-sulfur metabolism protein [Gammaproteobacteria bacterium]|nr:BolA/IbaG family iron-sulfur metabolism protein [Gammaproteobacteria bacterium]NIM74030.1 BolA/IbaG family iron-sulfur metabolism protein [Gammaproteobacteria bacterium]NIN38912.1 BolA/IbaG family iron-sulfur metabolism protein [Gammaproteobacteria bacterium]NIO25805.1 BolA/IbaG family iron-sulfur metabolism protein [Gammaproteobacteria bacterium]NIO66436.1 BolA/IbaG family iron-sulfur metabolism protein [Gammaproteobacteria bacterium]
MSVQDSIERKIAEGLEALHLEVINESGQHNVPPGSESHFKVVVVSNDFLGKNLVAQHRMIYKLLGNELRNQVHALALHTYTEQGWRERQGSTPMSPPCLGGKRRESA